MKFQKAVFNIPTIPDLKRVASAYVIDHRGLSEEELRAAMMSASSQFTDEKNIAKALEEIESHEDRNIRMIGKAMLSEILLNEDGFVCQQKETEDKLIEWESAIIDRSNEELATKRGERIHSIKLFTFLVEAAWEDGVLKPDEKNLIGKVREKLKISEAEFRIIEAQLGVFPKEKNETHTRGEIGEVRKLLQSKGLIFPARDENRMDFDVIPSEIAASLRKVLNIELKRVGYCELLAHRFVRSKDHLTEMIEKTGYHLEGRPSVSELQAMTLEFVTPSQVLGGFSQNDGLAKDKLSTWCAELGTKISGTKEELVQRIITAYDQLLQKSKIKEDDERETYYKFFEELANRNLSFLRSQYLIDKDLDCEHKFEQATHFLFEKKLGHKPLPNVGTERADGALSDQDKVILWDNKSKESACSLKEHINQFARYIRNSEKPVSSFLVIAPSFTEDSEAHAIRFEVDEGIPIALIQADELKWTAEEWSKVSDEKEKGAFPIGFITQAGRFKKNVVSTLF